MYIDFGKITSTHGIRGEVKIYPWTNDVDNILSLKKIYIEGKGYKVSSIRFHKNMFITKLMGINTVEEAENLLIESRNRIDEIDNELFDLISVFFARNYHREKLFRIIFVG